MPAIISKSGKRRWPPVRKPGAGRTITVWANTAVLAALQAEAAAKGVSLTTATRMALQEWASSR